MNIDQETLNKWAEIAYKVNSPLLHVKMALYRLNAPLDMQTELCRPRWTDHPDCAGWNEGVTLHPNCQLAGPATFLTSTPAVPR